MTVNEYINSLDSQKKSFILSIHDFILKSFEKIECKISYKIIEYKLNNATLYMGAFINHIGLYGSITLPINLELKHIEKRKANYAIAYEHPIPYDEILYIFNFNMKKSKQLSLLFILS